MKKRTLTLLLALALSLSMFTAGALAASGTRTIEVTYRDIKLVVDGVQVSLKDGLGNSVEPFISEGTTYLPVRSVGEALGKEVVWDGETSTVYIGKIPGTEKNWMVDLPPYQLYNAKAYDGTDHTKSFSVAGVTQTLGVTFEEDWGDPFAIWNTNCQYSTMTLTVGSMGSNKRNVKLEVYLDGVYSTSYDLKYDAAPKTLDIPINYAPNVKLLFTAPEGESFADGEYGIYDISFS